MLAIGILSGLEFYLTYAQSWNFIWKPMPIGILSGLEFYQTYALNWNFIWIGILSDLFGFALNKYDLRKVPPYQWYFLTRP